MHHRAHRRSHPLGVSSAAAGIVATAGQIGYALGIVAAVQLADRARLRRVSRILLAITALALLAGALAPSIAVLSMTTFVLSVCSRSSSGPRRRSDQTRGALGAWRWRAADAQSRITDRLVADQEPR
ncbi:hypothetical protein ACWEO4_43920 [Streptomyces sp. NPDC004393]|uniref:hypothetical protein n=1 Tax=Streptomyces sp. NPDC004533 TaxID=3154278 RepID=UPI0033AA40FA